MTADKKNKVAERDKPSSEAGRRAPRGRDPLVAGALRHAYEEAVSEDVPQEFLDLLGKLA